MKAIWESESLQENFFPEHAYFAIWATSSLLLTSHWNPQAMPPAFWRVRLGYEFSSNLFLTQESWGNRLRPSQKLPLQLRLPPVCLRQWPCWSPHQHRRRPRGSPERQGGEPAAWEAHHIVTTLFLIARKNQLLLKVVTTSILIPMKTGNCWQWAVTCPYHDQLLSPGQCPQPPPWYFLILIFHLFDIT